VSLHSSTLRDVRWPTEVIAKLQQLRATLDDERRSNETLRLVEELRVLTEDGAFDGDRES
jgi:hypothetical protein